MWSCYEQTLNEQTLNEQQWTNSYAEAAHKCLQTKLQMDHPSIWKLFEGLKHIQKGRDVFYKHMVAGHVPPAKRRKNRQAEQQLPNLVRNFGNQPMVDYLRDVAHNLK